MFCARTGLAKIVFTTYDNLDQWMSPRRHHYYGDYENDVTYSKPYVATDIRVKHGQPIKTGEYYEQRGRAPEIVYPTPGSGEEEYDQPTVNKEREEKEKSAALEEEKKKRDQDELKDKIVATRIISASVNNRTSNHLEPLEEPIIYTLEHISVSSPTLLCDSVFCKYLFVLHTSVTIRKWRQRTIRI